MTFVLSHVCGALTMESDPEEGECDSSASSSEDEVSGKERAEEVDDKEEDGAIFTALQQQLQSNLFIK